MSADETSLIPKTILQVREPVPNTVGAEKMSEPQKRWSSWSILVRQGQKHTYEGTVSRAEIDRRRAKNKRAKAARKRNRG